MKSLSEPTLDQLYPQARKLQFELKMQLSYLDNSPTAKCVLSTQNEARRNLSALQQILRQFESLIQVSTSNKGTWTKKLEQLLHETANLATTLEQHIMTQSRYAVQFSERETLLNRRHTAHANDSVHAAKESESLHRSSQMVSDLTNLSHSILHSLSDQSHRLQSIHSKVMDIANRLGLSNSVLRVIERRDTVDFWIVIGGVVITLVVFYICYQYS